MSFIVIAGRPTSLPLAVLIHLRLGALARRVDLGIAQEDLLALLVELRDAPAHGVLLVGGLRGFAALGLRLRISGLLLFLLRALGDLFLAFWFSLSWATALFVAGAALPMADEGMRMFFESTSGGGWSV
jgi:hypothetical protein